MPLRPLAASVCFMLIVLISSARLPQAVGQQPAPQTSPAALVPDDQFWDDQFGEPGTGQISPFENRVEALALAPNGDLYIGGLFARQPMTMGVARWNGRAWSRLGDSFGGTVNALAFIGSDLYAGGQFYAGIAARSIGRWDGSTWSALGSGVSLAGNDAIIHDIAVSNGILYAAGEFDLAGGGPVSNIARWDGTGWSALGSGINGPVYDLAFNGTTMYAGGAFSSAGGVPASNVARWDGTSWSALGSGTNGAVHSIIAGGAGIDVGGAFSSAGGGSASNIARWNGTSWSALGAGVPRTVRALMLRGGLVYAGTEMELTPGSPSLYTWNGTTWTPFQSAFKPQANFGGVYALVQNAATFYVGGAFTQAVGVEYHQFLNNVARWSGSEWLNLGNAPVAEPDGLNSYRMLARLGQTIYTDLDPLGRLLTWDGLRWRKASSTLSSGQQFDFLALTNTNTQLYMGGQVGPSGPQIVARWNGTSWDTFGTTGSLDKIIAAEGSNFYIADPVQVNGMDTELAHWNGTVWTSLTNVISNGLDFAEIETIEADGGNLYAAGRFTSISGVAVNNIARWNGTAWSALGNPAIGRIDLIAVSGTSIYVGSYSSKKIAVWNGTQWTLIGTVSDPLFNVGLIDMAVMDGQLYITGSFTSINGVAASNIARWNGSAWFALGSGLTDWGYSLVVDQHNLYVTGSFTAAGRHESIGFARWNMNRSQKIYLPRTTR